MVPVRKSEGFWQKRPCCKTLHCSASFTVCCISRNFSGWWLLASLDRCIHWIHYRLVQLSCACMDSLNLVYCAFQLSNSGYAIMRISLIFCSRNRGCLFMLSAFLPIPSWYQWYMLVSNNGIHHCDSLSSVLTMLVIFWFLFLFFPAKPGWAPHASIKMREKNGFHSSSVEMDTV